MERDTGPRQVSSARNVSTDTRFFRVPDSTVNDQVARVREEAEKRQKQRLAEMVDGMERGRLRIEEQKRKLEERMELNRMLRDSQSKFRAQNVERSGAGC